MIKLLDSTLRDGGYIIDWAFGENKTRNIIDKLDRAQIDYIEIGFLKNEKKDNQTTIFLSVDEAKKYLNPPYDKYFLMIKQNDFDIEKLPFANQNDINLRYIFKKQGSKKAILECKKIIEKGYNLFINPVFIDDYSNDFDDYFMLLKNLSKLSPKAISVVDSIGSFELDTVKKIYDKLDKIIDRNIDFCFHFHNNLEHSFLNAKKIIEIAKRNVIIDCCIAGMGRGAGNLATELIAGILKKYDIKLIENIIDKELEEFYKKNPWGNSYPYFQAAKHKLHPDYATFLIKNNVDEKEFENIFKQIPNENKLNFDRNLIESLVKII